MSVTLTVIMFLVFFFKQKTAYEVRISDWSSDVCSSDLAPWLVCGGTAWIEKSVDPMRAYRLLRDQRITFFGGVPALWERIAQAPDFADADLSELRSAYTGGAPVPKPLLDVFRSKGVTIRQQYGFTEGCAGVSSPSIEVAARFPASCGESLPGIELRLCDEHGQIGRAHV